MDRAAEGHYKSCHGCQIVSRPDAPGPLRPLPLPDGPLQDLAVDLLEPLPSKHSILVVVDCYSMFYEYDTLTSTTTSDVIDSLEGIFSRHGLPITLKSDNGPQFRSDVFKDFCEENGIKHLKQHLNGPKPMVKLSVRMPLSWNVFKFGWTFVQKEIERQVTWTHICENRSWSSRLWYWEKREIQTVCRWTSQSRILKCSCWRSGFDQTGQDQ